MRLTALTLGLGLAAATAHPQGGIGARVGASIDPGQFYIGGHGDIGPLVGRLWLRPNLEIGFGDGITLFAVNAELAYWFSMKAPWRIYVGAGPALNIVVDGDSGAHGGLNFLAGVAHRGGFFAEAKVGVFDSPDLKIGFGYTFR